MSKAKAVQKVETSPVDAGEYTEVERQMTDYMFGVLDVGKALKAVAVAYFCGEKKFYKLGGYSSEREFIEKRAGMSYRQGRKYKEVGQIYLSMFSLDLGLVAAASLKKNELPIRIDNKEGFNRLAEFMQHVGFEKFHQLTQFEYNLKELAEDGVLTLKNGEVIRIEELTSRTVLEISAELENVKSELKKLRAQKKETDSLRKAEQDSYEKRLENAKELELQYGPKAGKLEDKKHCVHKAADLVQSALEYAVQANICENDPEGLRKDMAAVIRKFHMAHGNLFDLYNFLNNVED